MDGWRVTALLPALVLLAACGSVPAAHRTVSPVATPTVGSAADRTEAQGLVDAVVLPAGATRTETPPAGLTAASEAAACQQLVDVDRLWTVAGTAAGVSRFLKAHPGPNITVDGGGSSGTIGASPNLLTVLEEPTHQQADQAMLVLSLVQVRAGLVGIRADGQVIPADADCTSS